MARPALPPAFVARRRLMDRLDEGVRGEVTLLSAGPGSGKTVLAVAWAESGGAPGPVAWLSLDGYDNSPAAFWSYVIGALRGTGAVPDDNPLASIRPGPRVDDSYVRRIANGIGRLPGPVVLVLEDLHEIDNPQVLTSLAFLLRHPVPQLRLVVTTRMDPALPLHRLRSRGGLVEIRAPELAFDADEAAELLAGHDLPLTPAELEILLDRTEGWAAGLGLAALFLRERGTRAGLEEFAGNERTVAEYLAWEILDGQPPDVRRFLLQTSIADQVSGELADALTGGTHGHRTLEELAKSNALVVRLGVAHPWFRYHHLLVDLLRHQLRLETPDLVAELHLRAAHWHMQQGAELHAVRHAVAAQDWPLVGRLVVANAGARIASVDRRPLMDTLALVPVDQLSATAGLALSAALLAYDRQDYDAIPGLVARARTLLDLEDGDHRRPTEIVAHVLDTTVAREQGDMTALVEAGSAALTLLADVSSAHFPSAEQYRAIALNNAGVGLWWLGEFAPADAHLRSGMAAAESVGAGLTQLNAMGHLALLEAERGCLRDAAALASSGLDLAEERGWRSVLQIVPAYTALALTNLERNDLGEAEAAFESGLAAQRADPEPVQYFALRTAQVRILIARGETDAARLIANRIRLEIGGWSAPPVLERWLAIAEAEIELAAGDPDEAVRQIGRARETPAMGPRLWICLARAHLALGESGKAEAILAPLHTSAPDIATAVRAWLVTALVEDARRQNTRAIDALARAVALAEPEGMRRPFVGIEPSRVAKLLESYQWLAPQSSPFVAGLVNGATSDRSVSAPTGATHDLTDRELDVLRYLPTMLSNADIAARMYVSVNTVKAHLRVLYRKLGVTQRREAVARAREMGLL
jgi:LuxR family maltose regulon positive regulatory protein